MRKSTIWLLAVVMAFAFAGGEVREHHTQKKQRAIQ